MMKVANNMCEIGERFNLLTVVKKVPGKRKDTESYFCKCDCGNTVVKRGWQLRSGNHGSCGCLARAHTSKCYNCGRELCEWLKSFPTAETLYWWRDQGIKIDTYKTDYGDTYCVKKCPWWVQAPKEQEDEEEKPTLQGR